MVQNAAFGYARQSTQLQRTPAFQIGLNVGANGGLIVQLRHSVCLSDTNRRSSSRSSSISLPAVVLHVWLHIGSPGGCQAGRGRCSQHSRHARPQRHSRRRQ